MAVIFILVVGLLTVIACLELVYSVTHSGYDSQQNRAPGTRIAVAAAAALCGSAALMAGLLRLRGKRGPLERAGRYALAVLTAILIIGWELVAAASGPL